MFVVRRNSDQEPLCAQWSIRNQATVWKYAAKGKCRSTGLCRVFAYH